jgi:hypothetical protein
VETPYIHVRTYAHIISYSSANVGMSLLFLWCVTTSSLLADVKFLLLSTSASSMRGSSVTINRTYLCIYKVFWVHQWTHRYICMYTCTFPATTLAYVCELHAYSLVVQRLTFIDSKHCRLVHVPTYLRMFYIDQTVYLWILKLWICDIRMYAIGCAIGKY